MTVRAPQNTAHAADAYRRGLWVHTTLADSLRTAAERSPERTLVVDREIRLDCATLYTQASALAAALLARMPTGSVVSFMLPNWHEAAVIYLAATLAGMVVNPILPSLRDHDLRFILEDANTAMIFVPHQYGGHDFAAMLERVTAAMSPAPAVVSCAALKPGRPVRIHRTGPCWSRRRMRRRFQRWIPTPCGWSSTHLVPRAARKAFYTAIIRYMP